MRELINILMAGLVFCGGAAMAASTSDSRTLGAFDKIEVSRGIELHVGCGAARAELSGRPQDVSQTTTTVSGRTLRVTREGNFSGNHNESVTVKVSAPEPLTGFSANTGVAAEIEACAVSPDHIDIATSTGVDLDLAGSTGRAVIDANTGSRIQPADGKRFDAREVKVTASTGAEIRLCSVEHIDGTAGLGSSITADSKGGTVHTSMGAAFSVESCK